MPTRSDHPTLRSVLAALEAIAPPELAAEWDNVGLLVAPAGGQRARVGRILLAIDLTDAVLAEARRGRTDLLVCYHPPIFAPVQRLGDGDGRQRLLLAALRSGIGIWSPHTALDVAPGGVNDWLAQGLAAGPAKAAIEPCGEDGFGRLVRLAAGIPVSTLLQRVRRLLRVRSLRVALPAGRRGRLRTLAVCAGAGGSVLAGVSADVLVTGEMRHHDVLAALAQGSAVVLSEHSHTERGYLPVLARRLRQAVGSGVQVRLSRADTEPLRTR